MSGRSSVRSRRGRLRRSRRSAAQEGVHTSRIPVARRLHTAPSDRGDMNTTTAFTRLTAAAAAAALAVTVVGTASAASAAEADSRAVQIVRPVTTPAMHRELVRESAFRYVRELEVRAEMAKGTATETTAAAPVVDDLSPLSGR